MKFLALVSGGKDSHYNIMHCLKNGHELVVMANIRPLDLNKQELDSFMFQTCGHDLIEKYPLVSSISIEFGSIEPDTSLITSLTYDNEEGKEKSNDEIEQLFDLLQKCKQKYDFDAVSVGAILSSYQRNRVEACCSRLGLKVLSYLWQRNQKELMKEMCLVSKQPLLENEEENDDDESAKSKHYYEVLEKYDSWKKKQNDIRRSSNLDIYEEGDDEISYCKYCEEELEVPYFGGNKQQEDESFDINNYEEVLKKSSFWKQKKETANEDDTMRSFNTNKNASNYKRDEENKDYKKVNENDINKLDARIIKTAAIGLDKSDLGKSLPQIREKMENLNRMYDVHICGEGGEFETMVLDSPIFDKGYFKLKNINMENNNDNFDQVYSCTFDVEVVAKEKKSEGNFDLNKYLETITSPRLFENKWEILKTCVSKESKLTFSPKESKTNNDLIDLKDGIKLSSTVCKIGDILHIQNIQPLNPSASLDQQCGEVFKQLFDILHKNNISKKQILTTTVSLKNMSNFANVNVNYSKFFAKIGSLPPSRACIGNKHIFGELQLSCIATLCEQKEPFKDGIHVQGISYWNPCNIGPYSQVILPRTQPNKIAYMAGQIPLIPDTMKLNKPKTNDLQEEWIENTVLTLRNYDHLKNLVGLKHNLQTICYLSDKAMTNEKSINSAVSSAVNVWSKYASADSIDDSLEDENKNWFAYEPESFMERQDVNNFAIVVVDELPAAAPVEIGGVVCANIETVNPNLSDFDSDSDSDSDNARYESLSDKGINVLNDDISYNFTMEFFETIEEFIREMNKFERGPFQGTLYFNHSNLQNESDYTDEKFLGFENIEYFPVKRVFDYNGKEFNIALAKKKVII